MAASKKPKKPKTSAIDPADPTTDEALLALEPAYAAAPDMPVAIAQAELASLARLAKARTKELSKVGISSKTIGTLARFAARLKQLETAWQRARGDVKLTATERKLLAEAEMLDTKLLTGGRWACRKDDAAQTELSRIAEGSGLTDTVNDLRDLLAFWADHVEELANTDITSKDVARAATLADAIEPAAEKEGNDADAAAALELRNRAFWSGDDLAKEIREGGRYAFRLQPKLAAKFVSRYRLAAVRRSQRKAKEKNVPPAKKDG